MRGPREEFKQADTSIFHPVEVIDYAGNMDAFHSCGTLLMKFLNDVLQTKNI